MPIFTTDDVQKALDVLGLEISIQTFTDSTATSQEAADAIGTELGSIVKSLCFMVDGKPVLILASGDRRVDAKKIAEHFGVSKKRVRIATAEQTAAATGFEPGGVPPLGHREKLPTLIDDSLKRYDLVYAAAGSANSIFPIRLAELVTITDGAIISLAMP